MGRVATLAALFAAVALPGAIAGCAGDPPAPAVDALAPNIPEPLVDSARALGLLGPDEAPGYLFVPAGMGMADATVVTSSHIARLMFGMPRRWAIAEEPQVIVARGSTGGVLVLRRRTAMVPDTLYTTLTDEEMRAFRAGLSEVWR